MSDRAEDQDVDQSLAKGAYRDDLEKSIFRLTFWQTILSVAAVCTGVIALYAALTESQAVRKQTAASVWPYLQLIINDTSNDHSASFALSVNNVGVGPARMQGAMLTLNGQTMTDWQSVADALLDEDAILGTTYGKSDIHDRVIAPQESVVAFQTSDRVLAMKMQEAVYSGAFSVTYCYCSIFDDCWSKLAHPSEGEGEIEPVSQCPDHGPAAFTD